MKAPNDAPSPQVWPSSLLSKEYTPTYYGNPATFYAIDTKGRLYVWGDVTYANTRGAKGSSKLSVNAAMECVAPWNSMK